MLLSDSVLPPADPVLTADSGAFAVPYMVLLRRLLRRLSRRVSARGRRTGEGSFSCFSNSIQVISSR